MLTDLTAGATPPSIVTHGYNRRWIWLICASLILIWPPMISFVVSHWGLNLGYRPSETEFMVAISSLFVSLVGAAAVALTLYLQFITSKNQQVQITENYKLAKYGYNLQIFGHIENLFLSEKYLGCRRAVWKFWTNYNHASIEERARIEMEVKALLTESIYDCWSPEGLKKFETDELGYGSQFQELFKILRYFDIISNFDFDQETAKAFQFYYIYYRRLIATIEELYRQAYEEASGSTPNRIKLPRHGWHDLNARLAAKLEPKHALG